MAEGKQQVKLVIIEELDLKVVTERMRSSDSWRLLPPKYRTSANLSGN